MQSVSVPGSRDGLDPTQTACEPVQMNGLRQVLWESVRPVQRKSVTQAFPDVAVGAEFGLAQFGQRLAMYWATEREPE